MSPRLPLLAAGLAVALVTQAGLEREARADDGDAADKAATEKTAAEKAAAKPADKPSDKDSAAPVELHYPPPSVRLKILTAGVLVTGTAWGIAFGVSRGWPEQTCIITSIGPLTPGSAGTPNPIPCTSGPPGANQLAIPIVGPWIALGKSYCPSDYPNCGVGPPVARGVGYVIDGVVQLAGIGLIVEALVMKTESTGPTKKSSPLALRYRGVELTPVPIAGPSATGMSLVGTF
jgi:hypothetical protein